MLLELRTAVIIDGPMLTPWRGHEQGHGRRNLQRATIAIYTHQRKKERKKEIRQRKRERKKERNTPEEEREKERDPACRIERGRVRGTERRGREERKKERKRHKD